MFRLPDPNQNSPKTQVRIWFSHLHNRLSTQSSPSAAMSQERITTTTSSASGYVWTKFDLSRASEGVLLPELDASLSHEALLRTISFTKTHFIKQEPEDSYGENNVSTFQNLLLSWTPKPRYLVLHESVLLCLKINVIYIVPWVLLSLDHIIWMVISKEKQHWNIDKIFCSS